MMLLLLPMPMPIDANADALLYRDVLPTCTYLCAVLLLTVARGSCERRGSWLVRRGHRGPLLGLTRCQDLPAAPCADTDRAE